jgi:hypothetical protein
MQRDTILKCVVTAGALAAATIHVLLPQIVPDAITAGCLLVAVLPWLASLIKTVEVPGIGKIELRELKREAEAAMGAARSASQKADLAIASNSASETAMSVRQPVSASEVDALADEYDQIRASQKKGAGRTAAMTSVVAKMIRAAPGLSPGDVRDRLKEPSGGRRLAAYTALYGSPRIELLSDLVRTVKDIEDQSFSQYWGIQAIGKVIGIGDKGRIDRETIDELLRLLRELPPDSDRYYELKRVLD